MSIDINLPHAANEASRSGHTTTNQVVGARSEGHDPHRLHGPTVDVEHH